MTKFKVGDEVICVNNKKGAEQDLEEGKTYRVLSAWGDQIEIDKPENGSGWWEDRFELVKTEKFLEDAFDEWSVPWAEAVTYHKGEIIYKQPTTNYTPTAKRSVPQLVADSFNQLSGKNITAEEVVSIINLHEVLKRMEK